jgi:polyisoprenoid-binding protein YceI
LGFFSKKWLSKSLVPADCLLKTVKKSFYGIKPSFSPNLHSISNFISSFLNFKKHNIMQKTIIFGALLTIVGLSACDNVAKGTKTEATEAAATTNAAPTMNYKIDAAASKITWVGTKPTGKHTGTIAIKEGGLAYESALTAATFVLDMNTISATDLDEKSGKADLDGHLKSADFFDTAKFPDAKFELTKVENTKITGNLTLKDVTKSISFEATVKEENGVLKQVQNLWRLPQKTKLSVTILH